MNNWKKLESDLQKGMHNESVKAPSFVWDNIDATLNQKQSKKRPFYFWMTTGIVLLLGIIYFVFDHNSLAGANEKNVITINNESSLEIGKDQSPTKEVLSSNEKLNNKEEKIFKENEAVLNKNIALDQKQNAKTNSSGKLSVAARNTMNSNLNKFPDEQNKFQDNHKNINPNFNQNSNHNSDAKDDVFSKKSIIIISNTSTKEELQNRSVALDMVDSAIVKNGNSKNINSTTRTSESINTINKQKVNSSQKTNQTVLSVRRLISIDALLDVDERELGFTDQVNCPSFSNKRQLVPFVEIGGLLGRQFKTLSGVGEQFEIRSASESDWYLWGTNISAGIFFTRQFYAGVGLEVTQGKDKFYHEVESLTKMIITFDQAGIPIDTSLQNGKQIDQGEIRYNAIDIPVFLGYQRSYGKWEIGIEALALFNLSFKAEGRMFNKTLDFSRVENESNVYKNKVGLGLQGALVFRRYLNNGFSMHLKPSYKSYLNEINVLENDISTRIRMFKFNLGVTKVF